MKTPLSEGKTTEELLHQQLEMVYSEAEFYFFFCFALISKQNQSTNLQMFGKNEYLSKHAVHVIYE